MGVAREAISNMSKYGFSPIFRGQNQTIKIFSSKFFFINFDNHKVDFKNPDFQNFKMWAWPKNSYFVLNFF